MNLTRATCLVPLLLAACDNEPTDRPGPVRPTPATVERPEPLHHDFGIVRHGHTASHEFVIPVPEGPPVYVPLVFQAKCSCTRSRLIVRGADGEERYPDGNAFSKFAVRDGDVLLLRIDLDTMLKEPAALPATLNTGNVVLQTETAPFRREFVPVHFTFGIDVPVEVRPSPTIDFGRMPRSVEFTQAHSLRSLTGPVTYGALRCLETDPRDVTRDREPPDLDAELTVDGDETLVRVTFQPDPERPLGPFACRIEIETDIEDGDYRLVLPVSGVVVADIEIAPPGRLSFGNIDMSGPTTRQVIVTDHDRRRPAEFFVTKIVSSGGLDMSESFTARFEPVPNDPRSRTLLLDYAGDLDVNSFRGTVHLSKSPAGDTIQTVEYVGYRRR